jgi:hypothetical protein
MTHCNKFLLASCSVAFLFGATLVNAGQEKVTIDKLPKEVVDAVKGKFPMADLKRATKEMDGGKTVYEVIFNNEKVHLHALVVDGKLTEIHRHVETKNIPETVKKAVDAKYPKAKWEDEAHERSDPNGKVIGYEITLEISAGNAVEIVVDANGMVQKETKIETKKDGK